MSQVAVSVPVEVTPEAQALVDELGYQAHLDAMIAKAPEFYPKLVAIRVTYLEAFPETHEKPAIHLDFHQVDADPDDSSEDWVYGRWFVTNFPPEVRESFSDRTAFGPPTDGR